MDITDISCHSELWDRLSSDNGHVWPVVREPLRCVTCSLGSQAFWVHSYRWQRNLTRFGKDKVSVGM